MIIHSVLHSILALPGFKFQITKPKNENHNQMHYSILYFPMHYSILNSPSQLTQLNKPSTTKHKWQRIFFFPFLRELISTTNESQLEDHGLVQKEKKKSQFKRWTTIFAQFPQNSHTF